MFHIHVYERTHLFIDIFTSIYEKEGQTHTHLSHKYNINVNISANDSVSVYMSFKFFSRNSVISHMSIFTNFNITEINSKLSKKVDLKSKIGERKGKGGEGEDDDDDDDDEEEDEEEEEELYIRPCPLISTAAVHVGRYFLIIGGFNNRYKERAEVWVRYISFELHMPYFIFHVNHFFISSLICLLSNFN